MYDICNYVSASTLHVALIYQVHYNIKPLVKISNINHSQYKLKEVEITINDKPQNEHHLPTDPIETN